MTTKNFGLSGIGSDVQLGKQGGRLIFQSGAFVLTNASGGTNYVPLTVGAPTQANHAATKEYVDSIAGSGLVPLAAARIVTPASISIDSTGAAVSGGASWSAGTFTNVPLTIDGVTLQVGDRVLVRLEGIAESGSITINETGAARNGIYEVTVVGATATMVRASDLDQDGEFIFGAYVLVEEGTLGAGSSYTLAKSYGPGAEPTPPNTINVDPQYWVKFSQSVSVTASNGLTKVGNDVQLEISNLSNKGSAVATSDLLAISTGSNGDAKVTISQVLTDLDIVRSNGVTTGLIIKTADDTYTGRSVAASTTAGAQGISVTNGNGVSGDITIGVSVSGLTASGTVNGTDQVLLYNGTNNVRATVTQLATAITSGFSSNSISQGNSSVAVVDSGTGSVVLTVDNTAVATADVANGLVATKLTGSNLTSGRVVITSTNGALIDNSGLTFNTSTLSVGNLSFNGSTNTISSTNTNGNIVITPNGSGTVTIGGAGSAIISADSGQVLTLKGDGVTLSNVAGTTNFVTSTTSGVVFFDTSANHIKVTGGATSANPTIVAEGTDTNIGITLTTKGTGTVIVSGTAATYAANVVDGSLVNKKYVDDAIATSGGSVTALQTEVNNIETAVGLAADGTLVAYTGTNYLNSATSIKNATTLLDTQVKSNTDAIATKASASSVVALGTEIDNIETAGGFNTDGTKKDWSSTGGTISSTTNYFDALVSLGQSTENLASDIESVITGAGLESNGAYTANTESTYLVTATSLKDADNKLDTALAAEAAKITSLTTKLNNVRVFNNALTSSSLELSPSADTARTYFIDIPIVDNTPAFASVSAVPGDVLQYVNGDWTVVHTPSDGAALLTFDPLTVPASFQPSSVFVCTGGTYATGTNLYGWQPTVSATELADAIESVDVGNVTARLDNIVTSTGLNTDGTLTAYTGTNYLDSSTSIKGATTALDTALKSVSDNVYGGKFYGRTLAVSWNRVNNLAGAPNTALTYLVDETDLVAAGFPEVSGASLGDLIRYNGTSWQIVFSAASATATSVLRGAVITIGFPGAGLQGNISGTDTSLFNITMFVYTGGTASVAGYKVVGWSAVGVYRSFNIINSVGLNTDGTFTADATTTYISSATSVKNVDKLLDTAIAGVQTEVNSIETAVGLNSDGTLVAYTGTNYINGASTIANAVSILDEELGNLTSTVNGLSSVSTEVDAIETAVGLNTDGTFVSFSGTNFIDSATSIADAIQKLDNATSRFDSKYNTTRVFGFVGDFSADLTTDIVSASDIPLSGMVITKIIIKVTSTANAAATLSISHNGNTLVTTSDTDPQSAGLYMIDIYESGVIGEAITMDILANSSTSGSFTGYIEYFIKEPS